MDTLSHLVYGATVCSRSGLAGGRAGAGRPWHRDPTVWAAAAFGLLPDALSLGPPWIAYWLNGAQGVYWRTIDETDLARYYYTHSLLVSLGVSALLYRFRRPLFLPSLAWALHIGMDAFTHGPGRFQTTILHPISSWGITGIRWWEHPWFIATYWAALPVTWFILWRLRRRPAPSSVPAADRVS